MSAVIKGVGVVWSVGNLTFAGGIVSGDNDSLPQNYNITRGSNKADIMDVGGVYVGQVFSGFKKSVSMTVVPSAATIANAIVSADAYTVKPGTTVTLTDDAGTLLDASYNVISSKQNRTVDGVATIDLELEQGDESNDLTTTIS